MSFNRLLALTYNGVTIGTGSSLGEPTGGWSLSLTPENGVVKMRFLVGSQNGNAISNMKAIEAAFSVRRKHLTIVYNSGTTINDFDPTLASLTGYEAFPEIRHGDEIPGPHSIGAETYEITVRFRIPADNNGRRDDHPALERSISFRRKVRFSGVWTAVLGSAGARQQFEDATTGFEPFATTFLTGYDNAVTWTEAVHDVTENDTNTEVSYHCEFWENVYGQVNEERTVGQDLHQLRRLLVHGTWMSTTGVKTTPYNAMAAFNDATHGFTAQINAWIATNYPGVGFAPYSVAPKVNAINGTVDYSAEFWECEEVSAVNTGRRFSKIELDPLPSGRLQVTVTLVYMQTVVAGSPVTALANYRDGTNGGAVYVASTVQPAISTAYGGVTFDGFVVLRYNYNEQLGIVEAVYRFNQINPDFGQTAGALRDTDIIDDHWDLIASTEGPGDSPLVLGGGAIDGHTGTSALRPIKLEATYRAWIKYGVDPLRKFQTVIQSYVATAIRAKLDPVAPIGALMRITPEVDPVNNTITVHVSYEAYDSVYLELSITENMSRDNGFIFTPKLSGQADDYLEQQGPTVGTKTRTTHLLTTQKGAIFAFASPDSIGGYRRLRWSVGQKVIARGVTGIAAGGQGFQTTLYAYELVEEFLAVGGSQSGGQTSRQATFSGTGNNPFSGNNGGGVLPGGVGQPAGSVNVPTTGVGGAGYGALPGGLGYGSDSAQVQTTGLGSRGNGLSSAYVGNLGF